MNNINNINKVPCDFLSISKEGGIICQQEKQIYTAGNLALPRIGCLPIARSERNCCVQVPGEEFQLGLAIDAFKPREQGNTQEESKSD
jgi:hypothetical protein